MNGGAVGTLAGTSALARLALRRDRVALPGWVLGFAFMAVVSAAATVGLYPTTGAVVQAAGTLNSTPSLVALYGRVYDPTSVGAVAMLKMGSTGALLVSVLTILLVVRHTRAEEESGRLELVGAAVVGRHAPLTAAVAVALGANVVLGAVTAVGLAAAGLPASGSLVFGLSWAAVGMSFAAVAAVTAQLARTARSATGLALTVLGAVYLVRAVGDAAGPDGASWLSWLSPIGWGQQFRPYAGDRWWVVLVSLVFAVAGVAAAYVLAARRDLGAGLLADRPGPGTGSPGLRSPLALAWRLHRAVLLAWAGGFVVLGLVFGSVASGIGGLLSSPQAREMVTLLGGEAGITDAFLAAEMGFVGVIASAYGIQAALRLRSEETALRAEPLLAASVSRTRWAAGHVVLSLAGVAGLLMAAGLGAGVAHAARTGDPGQVGRVVGAALVQVPAAWVLTGVVVAAFGLAPRLVAAGWGALVTFLVLGEFGPLLGLDQWVMDLSPFAHVPRLPADTLAVGPLVALTAVTLLLLGGGLIGLRRRDIA